MSKTRIRFPDVLLAPLVVFFYAVGFVFEICADPFVVGRYSGAKLMDRIMARATTGGKE